MAGDATTGSTVPRRQLGRYLRQLREETARMTVKSAAEALEWSVQKIWRIEKGEVAMRSLDVEAMCRIYGADAKTTEALMGLAKETKAKGWWHAYGVAIPDWLDLFLGLEEAASSFRWYESELVPGIFQTERYATAIVQAGGKTSEMDVPQRAKAKLDRQTLLTRRNPPRYEVVLNEAVLRRPVGGREVMAEQLGRLIQVSEMPTVSIRVVPFSVDVHRGMMSGPFVILDFPQSRNGAGEPTTIYVEVWTGALYLDKPHEVREYEAAWQDLARRSLDEATSQDLIRAAARELAT